MEKNISRLKRRRRIRKIRKVALGALLCLGILGTSVYLTAHLGRVGLKNKADDGMNLESKDPVTAEEAEEGIVYYQGEKYRYNDGIFTILFMGIDTDDSLTEAGEMGKAGQADSNFLAVINTKKKTIELIGISRDSMTDIAIYDEEHNYLRTAKEHLAIQFAYGDGSKKSCDLMVDAVSNLMYGLPIHGYCAINLDGIAVLNDAVGGVTVTVPEDLTKIYWKFKEGETITLHGQEAHLYVRRRDTKEFASNSKRLERQKQYLASFADTLKEKTKEDLTLPLRMYREMGDYMITDLSLDQITYLATELLDYQFDLSNIRSIEGEVIQPEDSPYEQFLVDYDALYELILEVFYEKVPQAESTEK